MSWRPRIFVPALGLILVLAACSGGGSSEEPSASEPGSAEPSSAASEPVAQEFELTLAHSYQDGQPQVDCGANVIRDEVEAADVGLSIEIFGGSQLGPDADRIQSVIAGDIDIDIQGASALSAVYAPMSAVDGAFVFDDSEHMYQYFSGEASDALKQGF